MFIRSGYYTLPHRMPHHVLTGITIFAVGAIFCYAVPLSPPAIRFLLGATVMDSSVRILRAALFSLRNKNAHPQRVFAHLFEVLMLAIIGMYVARGMLAGEMLLLFEGVVALRIAKHIVPLLDHLRSWRNSSSRISDTNRQASEVLLIQ